MRRYGWALGLAVLLLSSCKKESDSPTAPPAAQPSTNPTPPPSPNFVIFADELSSGGGAELYPGGENQSLSFSDTSNPSAGTKSIRYAWNGGDVTFGGGLEHVFAGMDLMHSSGWSDYNTTPPKDLRSGSYTRVTFDARGSLPADVVIKIEVADDGNTGTPAPCIVLSASGLLDDSSAGNPVPSCLNHATLLSTWQSYSLSVSNSDLTAVKDYFKATFIYKANPATTGSGGTVLFDQILYRP